MNDMFGNNVFRIDKSNLCSFVCSVSESSLLQYMHYTVAAFSAVVSTVCRLLLNAFVPGCLFRFDTIWFYSSDAYNHSCLFL